MAIITPTDYANQTAVVGYPFFQAAMLSRTGSVQKYTIFARLRKSTTTDSVNAVFALAGATSWTSSSHGVFIIQATARSSTLLISGAQLAPSANIPEWGYYDGGDGYWYIGVNRKTYAPRSTVYLLQSDEGWTYQSIVGELAVYDTAPEGWTTFTIS